MSDDKTYIIDPLTCICKLALLYFMPEKTKLAINHHVLGIQEYHFYQWFDRMKNGDSRFDISNLNAPLIKAIKWYIVENPENAHIDENTRNNIKTISSYTIRGLAKLQSSTYNSSIAIKIIIQYFIIMLEEALTGSFDESKYIKSDYSSLLSDKIKNNIDSVNINSISKMLSDADNQVGIQSDVDVLVECVHKLLMNRDAIFVKLMKDVNTTI